MTKISVAVVGCGAISTRSYLPDLAASPHVQLVAVCDVDPERARSMAERHAVPAWYADAGEMLAGSDFELLVNLTPPRAHAPLTLQALRAGRHVFSEKPLATTLADADALVDEAARRGLALYVAPATVISPTFRAAADAITSGEIGKVCAARGHYGHAGPPEPWFYQEGAGAILDIGIYNVVTLTGLLGPAKAVMALAGIAVPRRTLHDVEFTVEADDNAMILLDFGEAVYAVIQTGFVYAPYDNRSTIALFGTGGTINWLGYDWNPHGIEVRVAGGETWQTRATDQEGFAYHRGASYIAACMAEGRSPLMTVEHAYHTLEILLGAHGSARTGRRVEIRSTFPWPVINTGQTA
jgi:predicted dehydrogenase